MENISKIFQTITAINFSKRNCRLQGSHSTCRWQESSGVTQSKGAELANCVGRQKCADIWKGTRWKGEAMHIDVPPQRSILWSMYRALYICVFELALLSRWRVSLVPRPVDTCRSRSTKALLRIPRGDFPLKLWPMLYRLDALRPLCNEKINAR